MSENNETPKITTVKKQKDPKRVEAGKRLALISKASREKKMREKIENENTPKDDEWNVDYTLILGAVGLVAAIGGTYYAMRSDKREVKRLETVKEEAKLEGKHATPKKWTFDTFDN